jgi:DNA primase
VKRVYIAYDRDEAGDKAALVLTDELTATGVECFRVLFPRNCDANEYARTTQPAAKALGVLLNTARWLGKGKPPERVSVEPVPASVAPILANEPPAAKEENQPVVFAAEEASQPEPELLAKDEIDEPVLSLAAESSGPDAALPLVPPPHVPAEVPIEIGAEEIAITLGDRRYRVRGLAKNLSYDLIKINLLVSRGDGFHIDTLDLYAARQRIAFSKQAAIELGMKEEVIRHDLGHVLRKLEEIQQEQIRKALEPKREEIAIAGEEQAAAMELLRAPDLLDRILGDFALCGVVGEETNKLAGYIAAVSRHLDGPLAVIVQSSSAAGKSSLMDAILAFVPPEHRVEYSAMTGQSLFYMGEQDLKHKVLAIVEEQGASRAAYALKLLQSEGVLTIASTGKDPVTGRLVTQQYRVEGPVMIFLTTTAIDIDDELLNRCLVLTVNEDRAQTQAIHRMQRERQTIEGLLARVEREEILKVHRNAQRLLKPLSVVNPYARELTFPDNLTRTRRDHTKYLALINSIALLHQHQRPVETAVRRSQTISYIEVTLDDIERANRIAHEVLGRSLDELPPQTRRLLLLIDDMVRGECERLKMERSDFRFSRRDVRARTGWGDTQLKFHLHRLEELEYLLVHRGGRGQSFVYELLYERGGEDGRAVMPGLIDVDRLRYDGKKSGSGGEKSGSEGEKSGSGRPQVGGMSGGGRGASTPITTGLPGVFLPVAAKTHVNGAAENHGPAVVTAQP